MFDVTPKRQKGSIKGIVQGVGFRPFIYRLARRHGLSGHVINTSEGVDLEVEGSGEEIESFFGSIWAETPPLAYISSLERTELPLKKETGFEIKESKAGAERSALISPDVSICDDCLRELYDPSDRRYHYPFINCTNCGPRYTIIQDIPYDRAMTTMNKFEMCPACRAEYEDPSSRRFHAQPNACPECGPRVVLHDREGSPLAVENPVTETINLLREGFIVAVKGLGGFHLAVDAVNHRAVVKLRRRKHREEKPLALMVPDIEAARRLARLDGEESGTLLSPQRPIVLVRKRRSHGISPQVAPRNRFFGIMLPYTPLHHLILTTGGFRALVMTSGNVSEEPINIDDREAFRNLRGIADYFLVHDREIYLRSDDSIVAVVDGKARHTRRSRGYVPVPIFLPGCLETMPPVLALGAELKNTICITKQNRAFLSQHLGDMENLETYEFFRLTIRHLERILEIRPDIISHDLHPDYLGSKFAEKQQDLPTLAVQHHHAHMVSCLAENGVLAPAIGVILDGTGYGLDGRMWGGEVLVGDPVSFRRAAHLDYIPLPGGDAAARYPWRTALSYLYRAYGEGLFDLPVPFIDRLDRREAAVLLRMIGKGLNSPLSSSCGRLFDAVAALIGIRSKIAYEGQAAVELEMCQDLKGKGRYPWDTEEREGTAVLLTSPLIQAVVNDLCKGIDPRVISRRFHNTLIEMFTAVCLDLRNRTGMNTVALSGGAFQNRVLLSGMIGSLESADFKVYTHRLVPSNDGGLSLGQAVCAGMSRLLKAP